ncbi:unnamed protein product, partial [Brenthis ino]
MDPQPSTSQKDVDVFLSPRKKRPRKAFTVTEKVMIRNTYKHVKNETSAQCMSKVADILGITSRSVCNVLKEVNKGTPPTPPKLDQSKVSKIKLMNLHSPQYEELFISSFTEMNLQPLQRSYCKKNLGGQESHIISASVFGGTDHWIKNPSGKGKRRIISHIGSEEGFLEKGLMIFEAKKNCEDYHDEMNALCFEECFAGVLPKLGPNSIVVMENAPYHSRKSETAPKMSWKKAAIQEGLLKKNIHYEPDVVKATLLELIPHDKSFNKYAVNEMAAQHRITVLRLPPYHCELNPIELIWAQVKRAVKGACSSK